MYLRIRHHRISPFLLMVVSFLLLGIVLIFYRLGAKSLWEDEIITVQISSLDLSLIYTSLITTTNSPPLYHWMLHFFLTFGRIEFWSRVPAAIFGSLTLILFYRVERELGGRHSALFALLLLAISPFYIYYSQEARGYTLFAFWQLLSYYSLFKLIEGSTRKELKLMYVISSVLGLYSHYFTVFHLVTQGLIVVATFLLRGAKQFQKWLLFPLYWLMIAVLSLPVFYLATQGDPNHGTGLPLRGWTTSLIWENIKEFQSIIYAMDGLNQYPLYSILFFLLCLGILYSFRRTLSQTLYLIAWLFVPFYLGDFFLEGRSFFHVRYFLPVTFPYLIFCARGLMCITAVIVRWIRRWRDSEMKNFFQIRNATWSRTVMIFVPVLFVVFPTIRPLQDYYAIEKQDYLGTKELVQSQLLPGDTIVFDGHSVIWLEYYFDDLQTHVYKPRDVHALAELGADCRRVWYVYSWENLLTQFTPGMLEWSQQDGHKTFVLPGERNVYAVLAGPETRQEVDDILKRSLLAYDGDSTDTKSGLTAANCLYTKGDWKTATVVYEKVISTLWDQSQVRDLEIREIETLTAALLGSGDAFARLENWEKAAYAYNEAIAVDPDQRTYRDDIQTVFQWFFSLLDEKELADFEAYNSLKDIVGGSGWSGYIYDLQQPPPAEYRRLEDCVAGEPCYSIQLMQNELPAGFRQQIPTVPNSLFFFSSKIKAETSGHLNVIGLQWAHQGEFDQAAELDGGFSWREFRQVFRAPDDIDTLSYFPVIIHGKGTAWFYQPLLVQIPWQTKNTALYTLNRLEKEWLLLEKNGPCADSCTDLFSNMISTYDWLLSYYEQNLLPKETIGVFKHLMKIGETTAKVFPQNEAALTHYAEVVLKHYQFAGWQVGPNLFENAGFESGTQGWNRYSPSGLQAEFGISREKVAFGSQSGIIEGRSTGYHGGFFQEFHLDPSSIYIYSVWIKAEGSKNLGIDLLYRQYEANGKTEGIKEISLHGPQEWQKLEKIFITGSEPDVILFPVLLTGQGRVWIDDAKLEKFMPP